MAELFLRLGCALVAWLLVYAHGILLAVVPVADCSPELARTTLAFAALAGIAALLLPAALAWRSTLRWCALPALPLWIYAAWVALGVWAPTTLEGASLCEALAGAAPATPAPGWERAWASLQLLAIAACARQGLRYWTKRGPAVAPTRA